MALAKDGVQLRSSVVFSQCSPLMVCRRRDVSQKWAQSRVCDASKSAFHFVFLHKTSDGDDWKSTQHCVCDAHKNSTARTVLRVCNAFLDLYTVFFRERALAASTKQMKAEAHFQRRLAEVRHRKLRQSPVPPFRPMIEKTPFCR
jgi:hypothetical protein